MLRSVLLLCLHGRPPSRELGPAHGWVYNGQHVPLVQYFLHLGTVLRQAEVFPHQWMLLAPGWP
jgi:hypothetical protein